MWVCVCTLIQYIIWVCHYTCVFTAPHYNRWWWAVWRFIISSALTQCTTSFFFFLTSLPPSILHRLGLCSPPLKCCWTFRQERKALWSQRNFGAASFSTCLLYRIAREMVGQTHFELRLPPQTKGKGVYVLKLNLVYAKLCEPIILWILSSYKLQSVIQFLLFLRYVS